MPNSPDQETPIDQLDMNELVPRGRRIRPVVLPLLVVVVLAALWTGFWFRAASVAEANIAGWREQEERFGRTYSCGSQTVGGYPFRFEVRCADAGAELRNASPPMAIRAKGLLAVAQIYQPTLLIGEITAPLTLSEPGAPVSLAADWTLAQVSLRGLPLSPERISFAVDNLKLSRPDAAGAGALFDGRHVEMHARLDPGSSADHPVLDLAGRFEQVTVPVGGAAFQQPVDAEIATVLSGLPDLKPRPLPVMLKELQAAGGQLQVLNARIARGNTLATATGTLRLSPQGRLDGMLQITVAGFDAGLLKQFVPGLNASGGTLGVGLLALLGQQTQLEGRPAVAMPLRFSDGAVSLGPLPLGKIAALY